MKTVKDIIFKHLDNTNMRNILISLYYCFALILLCAEGETFLVNLAGAALASIPYIFNVEYLKVK